MVTLNKEYVKTNVGLIMLRGTGYPYITRKYTRRKVDREINIEFLTITV